MKFFPDRTANLKAADLGQKQITYDQAGPLRVGKFDSGRAAFCLDRIPVMTREKAGEALPAFHIVVYK
jgi:hypothetical protein